MMKRLFNFLRRSTTPNQTATRHTATQDVVRSGKHSLVRLNMDEWSPDAQQTLRSAATEHARLTFYDGKVHHGYALRGVPTPERCPRCQAGTRQHYANFIYATQAAPRVLFAPAGYFCTQCPTVVIDEAMIRAGIVEHFTFQGVLGIDYETRREPDFFRTWNGQTAVYIFDEDQTPQGIATMSPSQQQRLLKSRHKSRGKKRLEKASRRRNQRQK